MNTLYELSAITAEGFGGKETYKEICTASSEAELIKHKKDFALKYGVMLDLVKATIFERKIIT